MAAPVAGPSVTPSIPWPVATYRCSKPGIAPMRGKSSGVVGRIPAHFCGVFGHKPTWGIIPRHGQSLPGQVAAVDIDVVGPLARSADDLALALSVMAGPHPIEAAGWQLHLRPARQKRLRDSESLAHAV